MATSTTTTFPVLPEYAKQPTADMAATLGELLNQQVNVPMQQVPEALKPVTALPPPEVLLDFPIKPPLALLFPIIHLNPNL